MAQVHAVQARMELDLRVGAALTRTQTLGLQQRFPTLEEKIISYGQLPHQLRGKKRVVVLILLRT